MKVRVCPRCGKHNSETAWNCVDCGETLSEKTLMDAGGVQLPQAEQIEGAEVEENPLEEDSAQQTGSKGTNRSVFFALFLLLIFGGLWCVSSMLLSPPVIGPCAFGGVNYDSYLAIVKYWSLHLVLGYFVAVARVFVGTQSKDRGTVMFGHILTVAIVVWIMVAIILWYQIFTRLCV